MNYNKEQHASLIRGGCAIFAALITVSIAILCVILIVVSLYWGIAIPLGHYANWGEPFVWMPTFEVSDNYMHVDDNSTHFFAEGMGGILFGGLLLVALVVIVAFAIALIGGLIALIIFIVVAIIIAIIIIIFIIGLLIISITYPIIWIIHWYWELKSYTIIDV